MERIMEVESQFEVDSRISGSNPDWLNKSNIFEWYFLEISNVKPRSGYKYINDQVRKDMQEMYGK